MPITHKPKSGVTLTGTEYEASDSHNNTGTGATSTQAFGDAAADGTGTKLALIDHKHGFPANPVAYAVPALTLGTSNVQGVANSAVRTDATILAFDATTPANVGTAAVGAATVAARRDHVHATGAGTPSTQAFGDAAATGTGPAAAMTDHKHAMPANPVSFATPAIVLGTAAAAGVAGSVIRSDSTIVAFDATVPTTSAVGDAAATGSQAVAARRDHVHGREAFATPAIVLGTAAAAGVATTHIRSDATIVAFDATTPANIGTAATGAQAVAARRDHVHATGAGTPSTSAMGDAATTGSGPAAAMTDHKHARATATNKLFLPAGYAKLDSATAANIGASPDRTGVVAYADAATQGAIWTFMTPADWVSGVITLQPVWSPGSTDASAHTVRWSFTAKAVASGSTVTAAGTTTAWTGASAARTVGVVVYDTATSSGITPAAAGDLFRFTLQRIGADVNDTYVGVVNCLGVIVSYTANT